MTASATEKDQSSITSPNTPADVLPEDIVLQYIIKPTIGKHPHLYVSFGMLSTVLANC